MVKIVPTRQEFERTAKPGMVVPVWSEWVCDSLTPVTAFATLGQTPGSFLLESVVGGEKWGRFSFVGFDPALMLRGREHSFEEVRGQKVSAETMENPWEGLRAFFGKFRPAENTTHSRFWGGAVGYISYDAVRNFEPSIAQRAYSPASDEYDFSFSVGARLVIFDNAKQTLQIVVPVLLDGSVSAHDAYGEAHRKIEHTVEELKQPKSLRMMPSATSESKSELPASSLSRDAFQSMVVKAKEHILAGDIFQVVLSQRFEINRPDAESLDVYRALRVLNPSPYMYYLNMPEVRIAGASPETLVRVEDGTVALRPIAGTRPRGQTPERDIAIEKELLSDPKEVAEHVMLVDLGRNDVGRISEAGSVRITDKMVVERYSHVMHIVSSVQGRLAKGKDALDVVAATFPAGTLSGAPKVRAMQIIDALEPTTRGVYGGAVGYLGFDGNLDLAIAIRTVTEKNGRYFVQAGAGIVEGSDPAKEYEETVNKAQAALKAIETASRPPS